MKQKLDINFTKHNFIFLCICLAGLAFLFLVSVKPMYSQSKELKNTIPILQAQIAQQQQLQSLVQIIDKKLAALQDNNDLPAISIVPKPQEQTSQIIPEIKEIARNTEITIIKIEPLLKKGEKDWHNLKISSQMQGTFSNIKSFLFNLLSLPYLKKIENLEINSDDGALNFSLTYTVILA